MPALCREPLAPSFCRIPQPSPCTPPRPCSFQGCLAITECAPWHPQWSKTYALDIAVDCTSSAPCASVWSELGLALNFTLCICTTLKKMQSESSRSLCFSWRKMLSKKKAIPTMCSLTPARFPVPSSLSPSFFLCFQIQIRSYLSQKAPGLAATPKLGQVPCCESRGIFSPVSYYCVPSH